MKSNALATEEMILADLTEAVAQFFGLTISKATPINRGWLNLKWKISTEDGSFLLKQYNKDRFALYHSADLALAFSQQARLHAAGLPCPKLLAHAGQFLLESAGKERFLVMEFCPGTLVPPGIANAAQMYELGRATGTMHRLLNDGTAGTQKSPQFTPPRREERLAHWHSVYDQAKAAGKPQLLDKIEWQIRATERVDLERFTALPCGWAHRDLWADNILFRAERVAAILDFDRLKYDYPALDVARAVLSYALDEQFDPALASAFMAGYKEERPASADGWLATALSLLWYMESTWWITARMDEHSVPPARFAKEMIWLAEHGESLAEMLEGL
ncbi:putative homoserine kinase type II (protein kinase fold) [Brevibacillus sp. CF112]|uniref:homoserine kinase n=1 Tax=Brevibacillus TaxID=55080 RepID=UPI000271AAFA|nr:putative homoserine kinase type II (protein kinase fold) [Brevibacillus sp. CF112]